MNLCGYNDFIGIIKKHISNYLPTQIISKSVSLFDIAGFFGAPPIDLNGVATKPCYIRA